MKADFWGASLALLMTMTASCSEAAPSGPSQDELDHASATTDSWLTTNKSYDGARYVALDQINAGNVAGLKDVCTYDAGLSAPAQSSPLLYQGRLYFTVGQTTVAIDAKSCKELWRHNWELKGKALSLVNRGAAIKDGKLVRGTADGYLLALAMEDGKMLWSRQITSIEESHYLSMPPLIVDDLIIYGTAGADWGGKGWIGAFKLEDGAPVWKYGVLPEKDSPAAKSWGSGAALAHGGGSFWTPGFARPRQGRPLCANRKSSAGFLRRSPPGRQRGHQYGRRARCENGKIAVVAAIRRA